MAGYENEGIEDERRLPKWPYVLGAVLLVVIIIVIIVILVANL